MRFSRRIRQYWPITILTVAFVVGLPFAGQRPILTERSIYYDSKDLRASPVRGSLNHRFNGGLPFYGFESISLESPSFRSWWDGRLAATKLNELNANTISVGAVWRDLPAFAKQLAELRVIGVRIIAQVTDVPDWVDVKGVNGGRPQAVPGSFSVERATKILAEAKKSGIERAVDFVLIGGDAMAFATYEQRKRMYELAKESFPSLPILRRYNEETLQNAEGLQSMHPMGGIWDDYRFGENECDLAVVAIERLSPPKGRLSIASLLERVTRSVSLLKTRNFDIGVIVSAEIARMSHWHKGPVEWSPRELNQFASAILTGQAVDGLLIRGMGLDPYDLGSPSSAAHRTAFRLAAPMVTSRDPASF